MTTWVPGSGTYLPQGLAGPGLTAGTSGGAGAASAAFCWHRASHSSKVGMTVQMSGRYTTTVCSRLGGPACRY